VRRGTEDSVVNTSSSLIDRLVSSYSIYGNGRTIRGRTEANGDQVRKKRKGGGDVNEKRRSEGSATTQRQVEVNGHNN